MKKFVCSILITILLIGMLCVSNAEIDIDISQLSLFDLIELRDKIDREIDIQKEGTVIVQVGKYYCPSMIPEGLYKVIPLEMDDGKMSFGYVWKYSDRKSDYIKYLEIEENPTYISLESDFVLDVREGTVLLQKVDSIFQF